MNKTIAPDGTTYTETSTAGQFSRTGITGQIMNADGYTWATTVWFNGYSSSGNAVATQNGPRGWGITKAKFLYHYYASGDKVTAKAWLLDAQLNGTFKASALNLLEDDPTDVPAVASITASDLRAGKADGFALTPYGATDGGELWTGKTEGYDCIFVAQGEYVSSSCNPSDLAAKHGVSLHALSADREQSIQVAFSPAGGIMNDAARGVGFTKLSGSVAVNTGTPASGDLNVPADASNHADALASSGVVIPLLSATD